MTSEKKNMAFVDKVFKILEDCNSLLTVKNYRQQPVLKTKDEQKYRLKDKSSTSKVPFPHFTGIQQLYIENELRQGDSLMFTLTDYEQNLFNVRVEKKKSKNLEKISESNKKLADEVYNILKYNYRFTKTRT